MKSLVKDDHGDAGRRLRWTLLLAATGGCMNVSYYEPPEPAVQSAPIHTTTAEPPKVASKNQAAPPTKTVAAKPPIDPAAAKPAECATYPIDLPTALRLGDANNLDIALARNRFAAAYQDQRATGLLWLPDLQVGSQYLYHDGMIQRAIGEVFDTRRNSLFVGGGPVLRVDVAHALYTPLVARQVTSARAAGASAVTNRSLLQIAEGYLDLLDSHVRLAIAHETRDNAGRLAQLTQSFARTGVGLPSDAARAQTELQTREQDIVAAQERTVVQSAELARLVRLDARVQLDPVESTMAVVHLLPPGESADSLIDFALRTRPELAEERSLVQAAVARVRQARVGPLVPTVQLGYQHGGFGGGYSGDPNGFFGTWGGREDFSAALVWELKNLGLGDVARTRRREIDADAARIHLAQVVDRVVQEVVSAQAMVASRGTQVEIARKAVEAAMESLELNENRIRGGNGLPIELLQSIQALDRARLNYLQAVTGFNKAQFRLYVAVGTSPLAASELPEAGDCSSRRSGPVSSRTPAYEASKRIALQDQRPASGTRQLQIEN